MTVAHLKERMDARFKGVDRRFKAVDQRFDAVDQRFDAIDKRFDAVDERFEAVEERFDGVDKRFDELDTQFRRLFRALDSLGQRVAANKQIMDVGLEHFHIVVSEHDKRIKDIELPLL